MTLILFVNFQFGNATETNQELIELAKIYIISFVQDNPTDYEYEQLNKIKSKELEKALLFVKESIALNNNLNTEKFLIIPDNQTLYQLYIIGRIRSNITRKNSKDNDELISELKAKNITRYELVNNYYGLLFSGIWNKNNHFDLSKTDYRIENYELKDDTEKGIFFLQAMYLCHAQLLIQAKLKTPLNHRRALKILNNFPKFNGQNYYQYLDFGFTDFKVASINNSVGQSFKYKYINIYYEILLDHLTCLNQKNRYKIERENLLLNSILKEQTYYKYSENKETLERLFVATKMD